MINEIKTYSISSYNPYENDFCSNAFPYSGIDGDTEVKCIFNGNCSYKKIVKNCDGDIITMCNKY